MAKLDDTILIFNTNKQLSCLEIQKCNKKPLHMWTAAGLPAWKIQKGGVHLWFSHRHLALDSYSQADHTPITNFCKGWREHLGCTPNCLEVPGFQFCNKCSFPLFPMPFLFSRVKCGSILAMANRGEPFLGLLAANLVESLPVPPWPAGQFYPSVYFFTHPFF